MKNICKPLIISTLVCAIFMVNLPSIAASNNSYISLIVSTGQHKVGYKQISAGDFHNCALRKDGAVKCWGDKVSVGSSRSDTPVLIPGVKHVKQIASASQNPGGPFTCLLLTDGRVKCWGRNYYGQLGDGTKDDNEFGQFGAPDLLEVKGLRHVKQISAQNSHVCAVLSSKSVKCWGRNYFGELGDGSKKNRTTPVKVKGISTAVQVATGADHACALLVNRTVKCWGKNKDGQLGTARGGDKLTPVKVVGLKSVLQLGAGADYTCAVLAGGKVKCWGGNGFGQLGNGEPGYWSYKPVEVSGMTDARQVSAHDKTTCAVLTNGRAKCWGYGSWGMLGTGDENDTEASVPGYVTSLNNALEVSVGNQAVCALLASGFVKCWGSNYLGSADEYLYESATPVVVANL